MSLDTITRIESNFAKMGLRDDWSFREVGQSETNYISHGFHRYPAKFIPNIVNKLIKLYTSPSDIVCDPFGGCGTTLVEAKLLGRKSIGFDINPVAKLVTQTKIMPIDPDRLENIKDKYCLKIEKAPKVHLSHHPRIYYWFGKSTIRELDKIYFTIGEIDDYKIRRFFFCAFSHILKNCSFWLMKSIKPTIDQHKIIPDPHETFIQHLRYMIKRNRDYYDLLISKGNLAVPTKMRLGDSTKRLPLEADSIDFIVTSPPYVTSYEYADIHQLSLFWFGSDTELFKQWKKNADNFQSFRSEFIGTKHKEAKKGQLQSKLASTITDDLSSRNKRLAKSVAGYYVDMMLAYAEIHRILKPGKKVSIIIGNTTLRGVDILNAQVCVEQMINLGFKKVDYIKREVSNKVITPWRDTDNGRFTDISNPNKVKAHAVEYILVFEKAFDE